MAPNGFRLRRVNFASNVFFFFFNARMDSNYLDTAGANLTRVWCDCERTVMEVGSLVSFPWTVYLCLLPRFKKCARLLYSKMLRTGHCAIWKNFVWI